MAVPLPLKRYAACPGVRCPAAPAQLHPPLGQRLSEDALITARVPGGTECGREAALGYKGVP